MDCSASQGLPRGSFSSVLSGSCASQGYSDLQDPFDRSFSTDPFGAFKSVRLVTYRSVPCPRHAEGWPDSPKNHLKVSTRSYSENGFHLVKAQHHIVSVQA